MCPPDVWCMKTQHMCNVLAVTAFLGVIIIVCACFLKKYAFIDGGQCVRCAEHTVRCDRTDHMNNVNVGPEPLDQVDC